ncbi:G2/M phase-specific E3 ubiquitin-protein ligase-like [Saccoglossus kowalevskii]
MKPTVSYMKDMTVDYSPEGSNDRILEETTIYNWYEYLDDCAKGEVKANFNDGNENAEVSVQISLGDLLTFFTGVASVPPLGLHPEPSISFLRDKDHIFPTANTCANILSLPLGLTDVEVFGERFTYALTNSMGFGVV